MHLTLHLNNAHKRKITHKNHTYISFCLKIDDESSEPELGPEPEEQLEESVLSLPESLIFSFLSVSDDDFSFERI